MTRRKKGFSIVEALIAIAIITFGFLVVVSLISANLRSTAGGRNRIFAAMVSSSMMERIRAHRYGDPIPQSWNDLGPYSPPAQPNNPTWPYRDTLTYLIEGNSYPTTVYFYKTVTAQNGSFFGTTSGNCDVITVTIRWKEEMGTQGSVTKQLMARTEVRKDTPDDIQAN